MALGWAHGAIAGVDLVFSGDDCKALIVDAGNFELRLAGSNHRAASGVVYTQVFDGPSLTFGIKFDNYPFSLAASILAAIRAALLVPETFVINVTDGKTTINHNCVWDFDAQKFGPQFPEQVYTSDYVKNYVMRFIAVSAVEV